jgi:hypothetical protein
LFNNGKRQEWEENRKQAAVQTDRWTATAKRAKEGRGREGGNRPGRRDGIDTEIIKQACRSYRSYIEWCSSDEKG